MKKFFSVIIVVMTMFSSVWAQSASEKLQVAVLKNDVAEAKKVLAAGGVTEGKLVGLSKSLQLAVLYNNPELVKVLLEGGANAAWKDMYGEPVIVGAVDAEVVRMLVEHGADMYDHFPLTRFARKCYSPESKRKYVIAETRKATAAQKLSKEQIERAVKTQEALFLDKQDIVDVVNVYNKQGFSYVKSRDSKKEEGDVIKHAAYACNYEFLHAALATGQIDAAYLNHLISHPKSKGSRSKYDKRKKVTQSYIVMIIETREENNWRTDSEFTSILEDLLAHGADINAMSAEFTPLQKAAVQDDAYACSELIRCGADVHKACIDGGEAILLTKRYAPIKILFDNGADVFTKNNEGDGTLHGLKDSESVDFLVGKGVNINGENKYGVTPLFTAITTEMILAYLKNGADINHREKNGYGLIANYSRAIHGSWLFDKDRESFYMELAKCLIKKGISKENIQQGIDYIKECRYDIDENQANYLKLLQSSL